MNYTFDTNILLYCLRNRENEEYIFNEINYDESDDEIIISVVTVAEIYAIAEMNNWGLRRVKGIESFLEKAIIVEIRYNDLVDAYVKIDTFSQGKLKSIPLKTTARNMGKNDLWIAATASVTNSKLLTTDKDFEHLHEKIVDVLIFSREKMV